MHTNSTQQRRLPVLNESRMHSPGRILGILSDIHHNLAQAPSNATLLNGLGKPIKPIPICKHALQEASRARLQHLGNADTCSRIPVLGCEVTLEHPYTLTEPRDEFEVIGGT